jgi:hypothetical protein
VAYDQSSLEAKKKRATLNRLNRQSGDYGNGDGEDRSHQTALLKKKKPVRTGGGKVRAVERRAFLTSTPRRETLD